MSTDVFPLLPGQTWPVMRSPLWKTRGQQSVSGKLFNLADWSTPKWRWSLTFDFLRGQPAYEEMQEMAGFFNSRLGAFDSFLYQDLSDNAAVLSTLGTGDSTNRFFQLKRTMGGFSEPILAPNPSTTFDVYVDSSLQSSTRYTVNYWGSTLPGIIEFSTVKPSSTQAVIATFGYYWPVQFEDDSLDFDEFVKLIWGLKKVALVSLK